MKHQGIAKPVKSAIRTMALFELFAETRRPLTLAELARGLAAPKSSCHELVNTLLHRGYMLSIDGGKSYYPSRRLLETAERISEFNPIRERVQQALRELRDQTGETIFIGRLQGQQVVYSEVFDGTHTIRYAARAGDLKSLHASALGKALLASLSEVDRGALLKGLKLQRYNAHTLTGRKQLLANLQECERAGLYTTVGESLPDVMGMALPVFIQGHLLAIGMAGPIARLQANLGTYTRALNETVARISR